MAGKYILGLVVGPEEKIHHRAPEAHREQPQRNTEGQLSPEQQSRPVQFDALFSMRLCALNGEIFFLH